MNRAMNAAPVEPVTRFERTVLMPLQAVLLVSTVALAGEGLWLWSVACLAGLFYAGAIGALLHPLQGPPELARGPWSNPVAELEREMLPLEVKRYLVRQACGRVGWLAGGGVALAALSSWGWRWPEILGLGALSGVGVNVLLRRVFAESSEGGELRPRSERHSRSSSSPSAPASGLSPAALSRSSKAT